MIEINGEKCSQPICNQHNFHGYLIFHNLISNYDDEIKISYPIEKNNIYLCEISIIVYNINNLNQIGILKKVCHINYLSQTPIYDLTYGTTMTNEFFNSLIPNLIHTIEQNNMIFQYIHNPLLKVVIRASMVTLIEN